MTPQPANGPNAPASTEYGSPDTRSGYAGAASSDRFGNPWSSPSQQGSLAGTSATADAPTASVPLVSGTHAPAQPGVQTTPPTQVTAASQVRRTDARTDGRTAASRARGPRRARLQLRHIDPWTVLKFSCVLSIALFFVWLIAVGVLYGVLDGAGVISKINDAITKINGGNAKPPVRADIVFGGAAIIGVVNIVLFIALSTIGSVVYNLCADLVGGVEVTLSER